MERGVLFHDVLLGDSFLQEHRPEDLVRGPRIDIVCSEKIKLLLLSAFFAQEVFHRGNSLLVDRRAGIDDVPGALFPSYCTG